MTPYDVLHDIVERRRSGQADPAASLRALDHFDNFLGGFERELGSMEAPGASSDELKARGASSLALFREAVGKLRQAYTTGQTAEEVSALAAAREGWAVACSLMESTTPGT